MLPVVIPRGATRSQEGLLEESARSRCAEPAWRPIPTNMARAQPRRLVPGSKVRVKGGRAPAATGRADTGDGVLLHDAVVVYRRRRVRWSWWSLVKGPRVLRIVSKRRERVVVGGRRCFPPRPQPGVREVPGARRPAPPTTCAKAPTSPIRPRGMYGNRRPGQGPPVSRPAPAGRVWRRPGRWSRAATPLTRSRRVVSCLTSGSGPALTWPGADPLPHTCSGGRVHRPPLPARLASVDIAPTTANVTSQLAAAGSHAPAGV